MLHLLLITHVFFYYMPLVFAENTPHNNAPSFIISPPNITVPVNVYFNTQNHASNDVQTATTAGASTNLAQKIRVDSIQELKDYIHKTAHEGHMWAYANKKKVILGTALGLYAYTWYKLLKISSALSHAPCWHTYKAHSSFDELLQTPQTLRAQELIKAIQYRYASQAVGDFFVPFALFLKDIDAEILLLESIITLYKWINKLHVRWFFPWQKFSLEQAEEKLRRIVYIKNVALTWLSTFKFEKYAESLKGES